MHNVSPGHQEPLIRSIFPALCTGRWPDLAELVHSPFSIVTNSPRLRLGRSPEGLWLCLESSTAAWGRALFHTEGPWQIRALAPFPVLPGAATWGTHTAPSPWVPPGGLSLSHNISQTQQNGAWPTGAEGALDNGVVQELFNTHEFNST